MTFIKDHSKALIAVGAAVLVVLIGLGLWHGSHSNTRHFQGTDIAKINQSKQAYDKASSSDKASQAANVVQARQNAENNKQG